MENNTEFYADCAKAFSEIEGATKESLNPHLKSKYADLSSVVSAIKPCLAKHNLFFFQKTEQCERGIIVETIVAHGNGAQMSFGQLFIPAQKADAQGFGSALTYARRYSLMTAFGVCPEDDDGHVASQKPEKQKQPYETELQSKFKALADAMAQIESAAAWDVLRRDNQKLIEWCKNEKPDWWNGWPQQPNGFVPLSRRIEMLEASFVQNDDSENLAGVADELEVAQ